MKVNLDGIHANLRFSAAHMVIGHESCGKIHGHSYIVDVEVSGERSGKFGFVIDFKILKSIARKICKSLDHRVLIPVDSPDLEITLDNDKSVEFTVWTVWNISFQNRMHYYCQYLLLLQNHYLFILLIRLLKNLVIWIPWNI